MALSILSSIRSDHGPHLSMNHDHVSKKINDLVFRPTLRRLSPSTYHLPHSIFGKMFHEPVHATKDALTTHLRARTNLAMSAHKLSFELTQDGCGGAYLMYDDDDDSESAYKINNHHHRHRPYAVFKPTMEEYMAPENPRQYRDATAVVGVTDHPEQRGFKIGTGAIREVATYLLDATYGHFSGVPVTYMGNLDMGLPGLKVGSIQAYCPSSSSTEELGTGLLDLVTVQRIGILDLRVCNTDRHAGNILANQCLETGWFTLTPIDHGFCLPSCDFMGTSNLDWLSWPQTKYPFHAEALDHIAALDPDSDAKMLRNSVLDLPEETITTMRLGTMLLKLGANAGLTLHTIGKMFVRYRGSESLVERLVREARAQVKVCQKVWAKADAQAYADALVMQVEPAFRHACATARNIRPRRSSFG